MQFEKSKETMNDWLIALLTLLGLSNILQRRQSLVKGGCVSTAPKERADNPEA